MYFDLKRMDHFDRLRELHKPLDCQRCYEGTCDWFDRNHKPQKIVELERQLEEAWAEFYGEKKKELGQ